MRAYGKTIIILPIKEEVKNKIGLIVTDVNNREIRYKLGEVVSTGDYVKEINSGDKIYYDSIAASEVRLEGDKYLIINENDVRVVL